MNTTELNNIINAPGFIGAHSFDTLPNRPEGDHSIVVNTAPSNSPGAHWLALVLKNGKFYFLDSYGRDISDLTFSQQFKDTIKEYAKGSKIFHNKQWLQSLTSNVCGDYCVYFIQEMHRVGFRSMMSVFTDNFKFNDMIVTKYVKIIS